jgi:hypothetical protein
MRLQTQWVSRRVPANITSPAVVHELVSTTAAAKCCAIVSRVSKLDKSLKSFKSAEGMCGPITMKAGNAPTSGLTAMCDTHTIGLSRELANHVMLDAATGSCRDALYSAPLVPDAHIVDELSLDQ